MSIQSGIRVSVVFFSFVLISGCTAFSNIRSDATITDSDPTDFECITNDYSMAKACALHSISEFSGLLANAGTYDRRRAYALLVAGTASGIAAGFGLDEDVIKSSAVLTGYVLGERTIVQPQTRKQVLQQGTEQLICALQAAEAANHAIRDATRATKVQGESEAGPESTSTSEVGWQLELERHFIDQLSTALRTEELGREQLPDTLQLVQIFSKAIANQHGEVDPVVQTVEATKATMAVQAKWSRLRSLNNSLVQANASAGAFLSTSVIKIRSSVREGLSGEVAGLNDLAKAQADRIAKLLQPAIDASKQGKDEENGLLILGPMVAPALSLMQGELERHTAAMRVVYEACVAGGAS